MFKPTNATDNGTVRRDGEDEEEKSWTQERCAEKYPSPKLGSFCGATWDSVFCWPATTAGETAKVPCQEIFATLNLNQHVPQNADYYANRICDTDGQWLWGNWTNYSECLGLLHPYEASQPLSLTLGFTLFCCSLLSLLLLAAALFIFTAFRSLHCCRLRVHRNLMAALVVQSVLLLVISMPLVVGDALPSYRDLGWLCRSVIALKLYAGLASINWMFVEGLLLNSRITVSVFDQEPPFHLYYVIGWGVPLMLTIAWALTMYMESTSSCWEGYGHAPYIWIITGPMLAALTVNFIFLINIIRILVTKLKSTVSMETDQLKKAIKATAFLFPLLGITHLLFCINPRDDGRLEQAYMITNAVLQSSQGVFVAVLYCFTNGEVQAAVKKAYNRTVLDQENNCLFPWKRRSKNSSNNTTVSSATLLSYVNLRNSRKRKSADGHVTVAPSLCRNGHHTDTQIEVKNIKGMVVHV